MTDGAESQHTLAVSKLQALTARKKKHFLSDDAIYPQIPTTRICRQHTVVTLHFNTFYNVGNTAVYQQCVHQKIGYQQFEFVTSTTDECSQFSVSIASAC